MRKLIILIDLDDVLNNLCSLWVDSLNKKYGYDVQYDDISDWRLSQFFPSLSADQLYEPVINPNIIKGMSPNAEAVRYTTEWHKKGHHLMIVTSSSTKNIDAKTEWIKKHYKWFSHEHLILTHRKQFIKGDVLVDDGIHNLMPDSATGTEPTYMKLCFDRPWNRKFNFEANQIKRVHNFAEIDSIIKQLERKEI